MFIKAQNNNRAIAFTKLTFSPIVFMIYRRSLAFSIKWTGKYGFLAKTTFTFENTSKRTKIGTVTCFKPNNFH